MAKFTRLVNGVLRSFNESGSTPIYDESLEVVASPVGPNEIAGPITSGTPVTLPNSGTYSNDDLEIFLNGQKLDDVFDYTFVGTIPRTQVSFTFELIIGDKLEFLKLREA